MILPVFGHLLPNQAEFNFAKFPADFNNVHKIESKSIDCDFRLLQLNSLSWTKTPNAEKRQFMTKCIVFNQWFVDRVNIGVCVQTIENGTVILEGSS